MATRKDFKITISAVDKASGPLRKTQKQIRAIGQSMRKVGRTMSIALTAPIVAFGGFTIKAAAEFEAAMNRVRGITKSNAEEFTRLNDLAKELGSTTQFSASEAASAMEELARAGFSVDQVLTAIPAVLELAASSNVDLAEAASIAGGAMKGFRLEASELSRINDILVSTNLKTKTTLTSLSESLAEVAPIAASMGIELSEVAAAAGILGDNMLSGGRAGVALKTILSRIVNATPAAQRVLSRLQIPKENLINSAGNVVSLTAVVRELEEAGARAQDIFTIFGERGAVAISALVGTGSAKLIELKEQLDGPDSVGEAARQAQIRMEGAEGAMKEFRSAVEGLQIAIGESGLLGRFTEMTKGLAGFFREMSMSSPALLKWGSIAAGLVAVVGPLLIVFGILATVVAGFTAPIWLAIAAFAALIAVGALVLKFWEPIKQFFSDFGDIFVRKFQSISDVASQIAGFFSFGGAPNQLAGAAAGGGTLPIPPPIQSEVSGQIGLKIESDVPARVTKLESSGDVEIDVDSGPIMSGM